MAGQARSNRASGHITVVQERRFLLMTDDGHGCQLTLAHDAPLDADALHRFHERGVHVAVEYDGEPGVADGVAHRVDRY
jgi:hypothetical protein